jgi:hypothetical protein
MKKGYRTRAIIIRGLYTFYHLFEVKKCFFKVFFLKILALCMVSIQERFLIKSGLWWRAYGSSFSKVLNPLWDQSTCALFIIIINCPKNWGVHHTCHMMITYNVQVDWSHNGFKTLLKELPYARHHNPLLIRNRSWILTIHKARILRKKTLKKHFLTSKRW